MYVYFLNPLTLCTSFFQSIEVNRNPIIVCAIQKLSGSLHNNEQEAKKVLQRREKRISYKAMITSFRESSIF